jgi:hypothetical protein
LQQGAERDQPTDSEASIHGLTCGLITFICIDQAFNKGLQPLVTVEFSSFPSSTWEGEDKKKDVPHFEIVAHLKQDPPPAPASGGDRTVLCFFLKKSPSLKKLVGGFLDSI